MSEGATDSRSVTQEQRAWLLGMSREELRGLVSGYGEDGYRGDQLAQWIYQRDVSAFDKMTNLPESLRSRLRRETHALPEPPVTFAESTDGTRKYLYRVGKNDEEDAGETEPQRGAGVGRQKGAIGSVRPVGSSGYVEAAYIPETDRATLCLSSQVGCAMGCLFCATGRQGLNGNLTAGEILNQYVALPERQRITNIVYMGMGEPLDNLDAVTRSIDVLTSPWGYGLSHRRITVSTVGLLPQIDRFLDETRCHLAISLHSPFDEERRSLMPVQAVYPIADVLDRVRAARVGKQRKVSLEYIVFRGLNHTPRHAREIARLAQGLKCRINLIRFHSIESSPLTPATPQEMVQFRDLLSSKGIATTIRASRGEDIEAACGLLSTRRLEREHAVDLDY